MHLIPFLLLLSGGGIVVALHALRPDVHPALHYVSEYGNETWSWLLPGALVLTALGLLCLAGTLRDFAGARRTSTLMRSSAAMLAVAALFSTDRQGGEVASASLAGRIHGLAAIGAFCLLVLAMAMLSPRFEGDGARLGRASILAAPLALAALTAVGAAFLLIPEAHGLRQRAFLAIVFGWLLAAAFRIGALERTRRHARSAAGPQAPKPSSDHVGRPSHQLP